MHPSIFRRQCRQAMLDAGIAATEADALWAWLLAERLGMSRIQWELLDDLSADAMSGLQKDVDRLVNHEPLAHILGYVDFDGLQLHVGPEALIPRPETVFLVDQVVDKLPQGGRVLDVGAGAGAHSVYLFEKGHQVFSIDVSELSCEVMKSRGLVNVDTKDIWNLEPQKFDTVLFMMNGIGLVKTLEGLNVFFEHLKKYVTPDGQVLLDSSDLKYMFTDDNGAYWLDLNSNYYGELDYNLKYKHLVAAPFSWLFVDFERLKLAAENSNWFVELIYKDDHFHYLVKLTLKH